ncbi:exodeoxyribonuclease 7 large subunit [Algimonas ampicilliniresistens]|uniref:Exodeoxyribonuclease 7 large subunit n=1 Tax=Algimonas ampicilliniresistens TaxID=1298735 RepID=A0ABQ5V5A3_9PROT|nr:exodeoxyribonuclease VII large subunit [Algimonas ampicilliniresistens]GLQ22706.1 exodeoxyribonuclease 7 large subunit [Algimonas ampicilliniresistens]
MTNTPEFTVSELAGNIKRTIEGAFGRVRVRGELGRVTIAKSGHCYLDMKDDRAVINSIIWKGTMSRLSMRPEEGMEVIVTGKMSTYPGRSNYQLVIESMELAGEGALMALLERRKKALAAEGLFAADRKRALPFMPKTIGVVTSPTGAVIRDILHRISDRFPAHVLVWPVLVQGDKAAQQIAGAITGFNHADGFPRPDVLIVARGGGSLEDLWCFNEEIVVRAAANSTIPLISAVGHETDWTLIDYVSDQRAPTPTGAAEVAVTVRDDWLETLADMGLRLTRGLRRSVKDREVRLGGARLPNLNSVLGPPAQRLDAARLPSLARLLDPKLTVLSALGSRLTSSGAAQLRRRVDTQSKDLSRATAVLGGAVQRNLDDKARQLDRAASLLSAYSYQGVLARGYALVTDMDGGVIRSADAPQPGQSVSLTFADGKRAAVIDGATTRKKVTKTRKTKPDEPQHSLF